jgi:hypothetical protein
LALALSVCPARAWAARPLAEPIPWQDPAALAVPFLQLPFESPVPLDPGRMKLELQTLYAANIFRARSSQLSVDIDVETARPTLLLHYGLPRGVELELAVPGVFDYEGFLDGTIKSVEGLFNTMNPLRAGPSPRAGRFSVTRPDGSGVSWVGHDGGPGDLWGGLKAQLRAQDGPLPALSLRLALKVPTGRFPYGSGNLEAGSGLLAGWQLGDTSILAEGDVMVPTGAIPALGLGTRPHAAIQLGVAQRLSPSLTLMAQVSAHGAGIAKVHIGDVDGWAYYGLAGIRARPTHDTSLGFALVENFIHTERGADITAVLDFSWRW